jgi:hypothetical protein
MKALGWIAVVIAVLSVLFGISPVLIAVISGDEAWRSAGWAFMFATVPLGVLGIVISGILAIIACLLGMSRGAAGPGILGIVGVIGAIVVGIASGVLASSSAESGEQILAGGMIIAILSFLAGMVGTLWAGFAARPRA